MLLKKEKYMKYAKAVSFIGLVSMVSVLSYGFIFGNFFEDGSILLKNPWGLVSMVDLYVGFFLFMIFIFHKTNSNLERTIWFILMMVFGFLTAAIFILIHIAKSKGSMTTFFEKAGS